LKTEMEKMGRLGARRVLRVWCEGGQGIIMDRIVRIFASASPKRPK